MRSQQICVAILSLLSASSIVAHGTHEKRSERDLADLEAKWGFDVRLSLSFSTFPSLIPKQEMLIMACSGRSLESLHLLISSTRGA
jgi:hypothetical protein